VQSVVTGRGEVAPGHDNPGMQDQAKRYAGEGGDSDTRFKPEGVGRHSASEPSIHEPSRSLEGSPRTADGTVDPPGTPERDGRPDGIDRMDGELELPGAISDLNAVERRNSDELGTTTSQDRRDTTPHERLALIVFKTLVGFLLIGTVALTLATLLGKPSETLLDFLKFTNVSLFGLTTFIAGYYFGKRSDNE
jgi:hypothetical protein